MYQTNQEQQETNKLINDAQNTIKTANGDIDTDNASIEEYNERITLLEEQKHSIRRIRMGRATKNKLNMQQQLPMHYIRIFRKNRTLIL